MFLPPKQTLCHLISLIAAIGSPALAQQCVTVPPPRDAIVLFDGKSASSWVTRTGAPCPWKIANGEMVTSQTDIVTRQEFGDCQLHIEFRIPPPPMPRPKDNGNSGVYLHGHYELQVVDRLDHLSTVGCGAVYGQAAPMIDASLPPQEWQSFDVFFHAPRLDAKGSITQKARISVLHNGLLIHKEREIDPNPGDLKAPVKSTGPLMLQYHQYAVGYRNIWIRPLAATAKTARVTTLHVSPDGNDAWTGRFEHPNANKTDGPLASLAGARDALRRIMNPSQLHNAIEVQIADGMYPMLTPLLLEPRDSGTLDMSITYRAAPGAHPVFSGGRQITGFRRAADGLWTTMIPEVKAGTLYFEQLFVNGRRATRARSPNKFYYYTRGKVTSGIDPLTGKDANLRSRAFVADAQDIRPLVAISPERLRDVTLVVYHSWETSLLHPAKVDARTSQVITTGPTAWPFEEFGPSQRYHIENFKEALDAPGEWFLDRDGTLYYKPLPGEDMTSAEVVAPLADQFIVLRGKSEQKVENVTFSGLTFRYSGYHLEARGHSDIQAAVTVPAVVQIDNAAWLTIEDCTIEHVGIYGIWLRQGCRACVIQRNHLRDLGAGGVRLGEDVIRPDENARSDHLIVHNNIIESGGHIFAGAVGVWIGQSGNNGVGHNDISGLKYTGISTGWSWGYGESLGVANKLAFNHIHHVGQGVLSDMGGIYTLGISTGMQIRNNVIHDVYSYDHYGRGGWGIYNDAGSSGIEITDNLVYNVKTGSYHHHFGKGNVARNNILAFSMEGQLQRSRVEEHLSTTFSNNIVYWNHGDLFNGLWTDANVKLDHNLYWNASGQPVTFSGQTLKAWQAGGKDNSSIVADPMFVDPQHFDFHLKPGSPAEKIGFKPFDFSRAGVVDDEDLIKRAKAISYPPVEYAPPPPPGPRLILHEDLESSPVGALVPMASTYVEQAGDSVAVTDEAAASGKHSVKITDSAGSKSKCPPHFYYLPAHLDGLTRCAFDLRLEKGAVFQHEWRDHAMTYRNGPFLMVKGGKLQTKHRVLMDIPSGQWVHIEIAAGLGPQSTGTWDLTVTLPGQKPHPFTRLPNGNPDWKTLDWLGFISNADEKTACYLDNLSLTHE